jgi:4'-phosphopantetheinyl transferase
MRPGRALGVTTPQGNDAPDAPGLEPDTVHVWITDCDAESGHRPRCLAATTDAERERAARFHRREDGERFLFAHGTLRLILADYLQADPLALRFGAHANGKPFVEAARIEFNLSHSGALALIAVARSRQVGVDVEQVRPIPDLESVAARVCTPGELAVLAGLPEPQRQRAFFAMWTRKEALAKATGEGIGGVFRDARDTPADSDDRWTLADVSDLPGYAACVAAEGAGWQLVRRTMAAMTDTNRRR